VKPEKVESTVEEGISEGSPKGRSPWLKKGLSGNLRGAQPLLSKNHPLPLVKGKGIKGIGLLNKLKNIKG